MTHRIDRSVAVRHLEMAVRRLREAGAEVVVGTCPDLGAIEPVPQPLRLLARRWSRDLAAAQTVAVVEAGGRAVSVGDLVRMFTFQQSQTSLVEFTLPEDTPLAGVRIAQLEWPRDAVLVCIIRDERPIPPSPDDTLEALDELLFITGDDSESGLTRMLRLT